MTNRNIDDFNPSDERDVNFLLENQEIISNSIAKIDLRLDGLTILTEAATGNWIFTPFIAGMARNHLLHKRFKIWKFQKNY